MAIYRGVGGTGDSATGEDVFGPNSSITSLDGITGGIEDPTYVRFAADNGGHIPLQGDLSWNTSEGTLDLGLNGGDVILQIGQEVHYRVTNQSGVNLPNGSLLAFAGTTGNSGKLLVELYDGTQPSKFIVGVATETIANGANGYVTHFGKVRGVQTNGANYSETWIDGDELYPASGGLTNILPEAPNAKQPVAVVVNSHVSNGELFVRVQGHTALEDDEMVQLTSLTDGDVLQYDVAQTRFENRSLSTAGIQPTLVSGTNIKTVNSTSLVGSGDVQVQAYDANLTSFVNAFTLPTVDDVGGYVLATDGAGTLTLVAPPALADGDYGDITVSGAGSILTIDNGAVTLVKTTGVASSGANSDITSLTGLTTPLSVAQGGTGSTTNAGTAYALKGANTDITSIKGLDAGTALLPSITPTGDTNTGVWFPAADTLAISTGGSERVRLTSSGLLGVGKTPTTTLDILTSSTNNGLRVSDGTVTGIFYGSSDLSLAVGSTSASDVSLYASNSLKAKLRTSGNLEVITPALLGYGIGAGGTVTQATSKTTTVTLNKPTGQITTNNAALASGVSVIFTVNNSLISTTDTVILNVVFPGSNRYTAEISGLGAGTFDIGLKNTFSTSLSDAVIINFTIIKGATA